MNRSGELDDILEESGDEEETSTGSSQGETSPPTMSSGSPASSNSPQGSFRMIPRGVTNRSSQESTESSNSSLNGGSHSNGRPGHRSATSRQLPCYNSHKSQDSGFSDSGDSAEDKNIARSGLETVANEAREGVAGDVDDLFLTNSEEEDHNISHVQINDGDTLDTVRSEVVHETRTNVYDHKQYHVSKVYFYSVSDILNDSDVIGWMLMRVFM